VQNIFLALFNLLPAFPLDGGRILRALLALRLPYAQATRVAAGVGRGFAWLLGLYGFLSGGLFLIILAIFVYISAGQEGSQVQVRSILGDITVDDAFSRQVMTLRPGDPLQLAANLTLRSLQSSFPVCEGERLLGMLTYPRLLEMLESQGRSAPVRAAMIADVPTVAPSTPLIEAQALFSSSRLEALPVVDGEAFLGMITNRDINEMFRLLSAEPELLNMRRNRPVASDDAEIGVA
jgi:stage IV sporulation protein FB